MLNMTAREENIKICLCKGEIQNNILAFGWWTQILKKYLQNAWLSLSDVVTAS